MRRPEASSDGLHLQTKRARQPPSTAFSSSSSSLSPSPSPHLSLVPPSFSLSSSVADPVGRRFVSATVATPRQSNLRPYHAASAPRTVPDLVLVMASSHRSPPRRPQRSSRPVRSSRMRVQSYCEESSSEDGLDDLTASDPEFSFSGSTSLSLRPRRSNRAPASYREASTDESLDEGEGDDEDDDPEAVLPVEAPTRLLYPFPDPANGGGPSRAPRRPPPSRKTGSKSSTPKKPSPKKRMRIGAPLKKRRRVESEQPDFVGSGVIPPWQRLPYHILFEIFLYASDPLVDERTASRHSTVQWLVNVALLCRAFHEPALAALYYSPPLVPAAKGHGLLSLLSKPQESLSTNYANKIKELNVDVETLLLYKSGPTLGYFELTSLIERTPQLRTLRLYHKDDCVIGLPAWQIQPSKWSYPGSLFSSLNERQIRLRSWDWNARFMESERLVPLILRTHREPTFKSLRELRLLHVTSEEPLPEAEEEHSNAREIALAAALKDLPELRRLEFVECSIVNDFLLPRLPSTLTSLTINNCDEVATSNLRPFLASHGQLLRELSLNHNRHLNMSFTVDLARSCPKLEKFKMDISMHDWSSYHDVEPHFKYLLGPTEIPTWPQTLREIELLQLRNWDDITAEAFFTSLIDSAPDLKGLRKLIISAILKIGWRDRATFREKWISRLESVFLRRSAPPDPNLRSIPRPAAPNAAAPPSTAEGTISGSFTQSDATHTANEMRLDSGPSTPSKRKSARLAQRQLSFSLEDPSMATKSRRSSSARARNGIDDAPVKYVQGMCDVVMIRIDNHRPAETQFNENDFLDDELSGDEDWNGHDFDPDGGHAW